MRRRSGMVGGRPARVAGDRNRLEITVDDGFRRDRFLLDHPSRGLLIGPMVWRNLINFSPGAVGLVLASAHYDERDYYREYDDFLRDARRRAGRTGRSSA